ncbi:MAG TPA: hypothetical protein VKD21_08045, partial [Acidimicrobiales bacterium]|nr:hypothetical protein [Acidimicrobiales bacterium]
AREGKTVGMAHELVIKGGTIVDGTGAERFTGDVGVDGGRITAVALAVVAPRMPQVPWSLRTGPRRRPHPQPRVEDAQVTLPAR